MEKASYQRITLPASRIATYDVGRIGRKKHHIYGLVEIDITDARDRIRGLIREGSTVSLHSWLIKCIGDTISTHRFVQGIRKGSREQIIFDDVDISIPIERIVDGKAVPLVALIRKVDAKSVEEIAQEISSMRGKTICDEKDYVLSRKGSFSQRLFYRLPSSLRILFWQSILKQPFRRKAAMGTAIITSVGLTGGVSGWILPKSIHNLGFGVGSIVKKPWVHDDTICIREILNLTVIFDHDIIDGAPAAKFVNQLKKHLESGHGLP